jgi:hypothetical protein
VNDELKWCGRKQSWPNFKVLSRHSPGRPEKSHEKPQSIRSPGRDLNPGHPENKAWVLTTLRLVWKWHFLWDNRADDGDSTSETPSTSVRLHDPISQKTAILVPCSLYRNFFTVYRSGRLMTAWISEKCEKIIVLQLQTRLASFEWEKRFYLLTLDLPNAVVEWLTLLLRIREIPGLNLGPETGYIDWRSLWLYLSLQTNIGIYLKLGYDRFLPTYFQFIIHLSPFYSMLHILELLKCVVK